MEGLARPLMDFELSSPAKHMELLLPDCPVSTCVLIIMVVLKS